MLLHSIDYMRSLAEYIKCEFVKEGEKKQEKVPQVSKHSKDEKKNPELMNKKRHRGQIQKKVIFVTLVKIYHKEKTKRRIEINMH